MANPLSSRLKKAWNIFLNRDPDFWMKQMDLGTSYSTRPDRRRLTRGNERSIVNALCTRITLDAAAINLQHIRMDENKRFLGEINSDLNNCLTMEANIDQTGRAFRQDIIMSMLDEGVVAVVPTELDDDPDENGSRRIYQMRTAKILEWKPRHIKVHIYNDVTGRYEDIIVSKETTAIIENPLYSIMNEPNSILQRLVRKLNLLDVIDEQSGSGKLDLIIQLPYSLKTDLKREQAEVRRKDIENQLAGSKYGIAYIDSTEHITQLNRGVENNLMNQIEYLTKMLYSQTGFDEGILNGTANEETMINYHNRIIEPVLSALADEMNRKFLTKTARSQGQAIYFFRDPFKLAPISQIAELADKFTRNEIMSSNEVRQVIGLKPSDDPKADALENKNINHANDANASSGVTEELPMTEAEIQGQINDLDELDDQLSDLEDELGHSDEPDEDDADSLIHYASPYYDPVKAHEYYEEHKKLKGRHSTAGLNDAGREAAQYVKEQLSNERKQKVEKSKSTHDTNVETNNNTAKEQIESQTQATRTQLESHKAQTQARIETLQAALKRMSSSQRAARSGQIQAEISSLRESNASMRESLQSQLKAFRTKVTEDKKTANTKERDTHKQNTEAAKAEYESKYDAELEKIRNTAEFQSTKKKK